MRKSILTAAAAAFILSTAGAGVALAQDDASKQATKDAKAEAHDAKKAASTAKHKAKTATHKAKVAADKAEDAAKDAAATNK